ncbi:CocE/NonD family hydrolase [Cohaesibacter celericrescens]|uniref:Peptidase n=1 Tax=Cohaesibacter celericrescens TaxID=2067669 RepID=A0A2N5XXQ4_9HYPH|nr:CocE/NonD family hydrolase [Cohaesibacter celericrescens]PLW79283.1 peptidase [Cohaesibacter celericrescens]
MLNRGFSVSEDQWITLKDGTRLSTRIWMPEGSEGDPVPAVLEFLPYRKRDGTSPRDESTYPVFAAAGIAGVRVDIRGSGESEGVIDGEYTPRELSDACEIIDWIANQTWSNGNVGMMGISWGGFNCLQTAALKPKALKAVISIASTVDRYNDDIHYKNGCHLYANLSWAATMLAYQSRSPDPALVGDTWKDMWLERLEGEPYFLEEWMQHQRRDAFWQHGSICEDFDNFDTPALVIAGWADGYRNTPLKAIEGIGTKAKALIGPWIHKYPHFAFPKPRTDFLSEAITWWNRWLRDENNGAEAIPQMRAFILDGPRPTHRREQDPGFWVAKQCWETPQLDIFSVADDQTLVAGKNGGGIGSVYVRSPLDSGTNSGEWFALKPDAEIAGDQRIDDASALTFDSAPFTQEGLYLGRPELSLDLSCEADWENLVARIVDVHPDGTATRVSYGVLNLAHRDSNAAPTAMPIGKKTSITIMLDACGYRFGPGHRMRLSLATASWPLILPSPEASGLTIDTGSIRLAMPALGEHEAITIPAPSNPDPLPVYISHKEGETRRTVERDLMTGMTHYRIYEDTGLEEHPDTSLCGQEIRTECWSINAQDPQSMRGHCEWITRYERQGWTVETRTTSTLTCTKEDWILKASVKAFESDNQIFEKTFESRVKRDFM